MSHLLPSSLFFFSLSLELEILLLGKGRQLLRSCADRVHFGGASTDVWVCMMGIRLMDGAEGLLRCISVAFGSAFAFASALAPASSIYGFAWARSFFHHEKHVDFFSFPALLSPAGCMWCRPTWIPASF